MASASRPVRVIRRSALGLLAAGGLVLAGCGGHHRPVAAAWPGVRLTAQDRVLILAPHPDDEVLGCGGIIQAAVAMRLPLRIAFFTYGDNNQWSFLLYRRHPVLLPTAVRRMGLVRHDEAVAAAAAFGVTPEHLTFLGYPDFGTMAIWRAHWGDQPPVQSMLTHVTAVPYANALRPGAAYKGEEIVRDLTTLLRDFRPTKVFVSHPSDHMPDHAALYLFTRVALWEVAAELRPELYPYLVHFRRWPTPRGSRMQRVLEPPDALRDLVRWHSYSLSRAGVERKWRAIRAHRTQYNASARYLLSFIRPNELFGDFPPVALRPSQASASLAAGAAAQGFETPEELTEEERATFVGVETQSVQLDGGDLVLTIAFSRPLAGAVQSSVYAFGYRPDRPFAEMPKLHVRLRPLGQTVYNQDRPLPSERVAVVRRLKQVTIRLPLELLGWPDRVLVSARTYLGDLPLDWVSWRVLELSPNGAGAAGS